MKLFFVNMVTMGNPKQTIRLITLTIPNRVSFISVTWTSWSYHVWDLCVCTRRLCIGLSIVINDSLLSLLIYFLWFKNLMNNDHMDRDNKNPTQHLPWWLRKTTKKPQSDWLGPGFELRTSRIWDRRVTTAQLRFVEIRLWYYYTY